MAKVVQPFKQRPEFAGLIDIFLTEEEVTILDKKAKEVGHPGLEDFLQMTIECFCGTCKKDSYPGVH